MRKRYEQSGGSEKTGFEGRFSVRAVALIANYCKTKDLAGGPACRAAGR